MESHIDRGWLPTYLLTYTYLLTSCLLPIQLLNAYLSTTYPPTYFLPLYFLLFLAGAMSSSVRTLSGVGLISSLTGLRCSVWCLSSVCSPYSLLTSLLLGG